MPVPLGNHVQGEADRSVITMEPMGIRLQWGLPSVGEMGLALSDALIFREIGSRKTRIRSVIQNMLPTCMAVITVLEAGLNLVDKIVL